MSGKLDYERQLAPRPSRRDVEPFAAAPMWLTGIALLVDGGIYHVAEESGRQAWLPNAVVLVSIVCIVGVTIGAVALVRRRAYRNVAVLAMLLHVAIAAAFIFAIGMLA